MKHTFSTHGSGSRFDANVYRGARLDQVFVEGRKDFRSRAEAVKWARARARELDGRPARPPKAHRADNGHLSRAEDMIEDAEVLEAALSASTTDSGRLDAEPRLHVDEAMVVRALDAYFGNEWRLYSHEDDELVRCLMTRALQAALTDPRQPSEAPVTAEGWRLLQRCYAAIGSVAWDALGFAEDEAGRWPIREELLQKLEQFLSRNPPAPPTEAPVTADEGWRPIESAPRDGTTILVFDAGHPEWQEARVMAAHWADDEGTMSWAAPYSWQDEQGGFETAHNATHWRPLPAPPTGEGKPQGEEN